MIDPRLVEDLTAEMLAECRRKARAAALQEVIDDIAAMIKPNTRGKIGLEMAAHVARNKQMGKP